MCEMSWLRALYVSNGLAVGTLYGFVPVLLQSKGFDPALIGLTTGLGSLAYMVALPAWGHLGDVVSGPRRALQLASVPAAIFALGLGAPLPAFAIIACQMILSAGGGPAMALTDAMAMPLMANASREYSRLRLLSSMGAAVGAVGCGLIYAQTGYLAAPFLYAVTIAMTIVCAQLVPMGRDSERHRRIRDELAGDELAGDLGGGVRAPHPPAARPRRFGSVGEAFTVRPRLAWVLISVTLVYMGVMAAGTYMSLRIADLGNGAVGVGLFNGIGWFAEVPGLILAGWLVCRFGIRPILLVSAVGFGACLASFAVLADELPIMVARFVSGIFFGGIVVSFVLTIAQMLPGRLQATGQTLFQAAGFGAAAILANVIGGVLYATAGPLGVFGGGALCAVLGGVVGFVALAEDEPVSAGVLPEAVSLAG